MNAQSTSECRPQQNSDQSTEGEYRDESANANPSFGLAQNGFPCG